MCMNSYIDRQNLKLQAARAKTSQGLVFSPYDGIVCGIVRMPDGLEQLDRADALTVMAGQDPSMALGGRVTLSPVRRYSRSKADERAARTAGIRIAPCMPFDAVKSPGCHFLA